MTEKISYIPSRLKNAAIGGHVAGAEDIFDDSKNKNQAVINSENDANFAQIDNEIEALEKQDVIPVDELPSVSEADPKAIYRVAGEDNYTDYMVNASGDGWKLMAEFSFPGIDEEPTKNSSNLVESGGVHKYVNDRGTKVTLGYNASKDEIKILAIKGHTYKFSLSDTTVFRTYTEQEGNARLGIFVKYEDVGTETTLYSDSYTKTIQESYTYTLDSDKGAVEYIRISARIQQLKQLICQIDDIEKTFNELVSLKSGLIIDRTSNDAVELSNRIKKIEVDYVGDSSSYNDYSIYRPDGTPRKFRFRNFADDNSGATLVDGGRAIVWVEQDDGALDGSHSGWYFMICRGGNNVYHGLYRGFKVTIYTNGWGTQIIPPLHPLDQVAEINFELFKSAVDNLDYTHSVLDRRNRFTSDLEVVNNSVGGWEIRYPETDSVVKNEDGSFRVTLVKNSNNNPGIWLLYHLDDNIREKSICWTFYAKKAEDSEGSILRVNPNIPSSHPSITLSEEWTKYTFNTALGSSNSDNRLMLFKANSVDTLVFDIKDMQCWLVNDESYYDEQLIDLTQKLSDSSKEIEKPFTNSLYKIASIERNITPEGAGAPQAIIALLGDSWTQHSWDTTPPGSQASPAHTNYVQPLKKYLQDKYGNAGGGLYSFSCSHEGKAKMGCADPDDADDERTGTITYRDQESGCRCVDAADATFMEGSSLVLHVRTAHDKFIIHFYGDSEAGVFTYQIDDEEAVSVDASEYEGHTTIVVDTTDSTHTITFTAVSGDTMIFGVDMQRTSAGIRVHKIGNKGATTTSYTIVDADCWKAMLGSLGIDSMTIMLGVNDGSSGTSSVQMNLETIVGNIREINPYVDITIVQPSCTKTLDLTEQAKYSFKAASNLGVGYLSLIDLFGSPAKITEKGMFYDNLHPSLSGGRMISDYLIKKLLLLKC